MKIRLLVLFILGTGLMWGCSKFNDSTLGRYYQDCGNFGNYYGEVCDTESHVSGSYAALEKPQERDYSSELGTLQSKVSDQDREIARLKSELQSAQQQLADKDQALAGYGNQEADKARLQQERDDLARRIAELESEQSQLSQQVSERDATIASLQAGQSGMTATEAELNQLRAQLATTGNDKMQLEGDKTQLAQDIANREAEIARLQAALKAQEESNGSLTQSVADRDAQLAALQSKHDALANQLNVNIAEMNQVHEDLFQLLKPQIEKGNIKIQQVGDQLTINMADRLLFDSGKAELKNEGALVLKKVGEILQQASNKRVKVQGHTDNVPIRGRLKKRFPTNLVLSQERAANAAQFLQEGGVESGRVTTEGLGDTKPIASNQVAEGRQKNRRVDIVVSN